MPGATRTIRFDTRVAMEAAGAFLENVASVVEEASGAAVLSNGVLIGVDGAGVLPGTGDVLPRTGGGVSRTLGAGLTLTVIGWSLLFIARREDPIEPRREHGDRRARRPAG